MGAALEILVEELISARKSRGMTQEEWAKTINFSPTHVSSVETRHRPPTADYVAAVDEAFQTGGIYGRLLVKLAGFDNTPLWLRPWLDHEGEAKLLRWYEPAFVPGLLQTEAYARGMLAGVHLTAETAEQRVNSRLARQALLTGDDAPQLVFVIDEMVLRRPIQKRPGVLAEQLEHLVACAELPHVQILVVPQDVGLYPALQGGFILATLPDNSVVAHLDNQVRAQIIDGGDDVVSLQGAWEAVRGEALPRRLSLELIKEVAKAWT